MPYKPMPRREFERRLKNIGWSLVKGSIEWKLLDEQGRFICTIKIAHPGPNEVIAPHVVRVEKELKTRGLSWDRKRKDR